MKCDDAITVDVHVGRTLREFVVSTKGSDVLTPEKDSILWCLLKQHLVTSAEGYIPIPDELKGEYVRIALRSAHSATSYNVPAGRTIQINTLFRCYLDKTGENTIRKYLTLEFKKTFRDYMTGCLAINDKVRILDAIEEFCKDHGIPLDGVITFEMLRKDWYRYCKNKDKKRRISIET